MNVRVEMPVVNGNCVLTQARLASAILNKGGRARGGQAPYGFRQLAFVQECKGESGEGARRAIEGVATARVPRTAALDAALRPELDIHGRREPDPHRHPAEGNPELSVVAQLAAYGRGEDVPALRVDPPGARHVPMNLTVVDQG